MDTVKTRKRMNPIEVARHYREDDQRVGGVVVLFEGEVQGWVNTQRNPENWRPCCIAVDRPARGGLRGRRIGAQHRVRRGSRRPTAGRHGSRAQHP